MFDAGDTHTIPPPPNQNIKACTTATSPELKHILNVFHSGNVVLQFIFCHTMETQEIKFMCLHIQGFQQNTK